MERHRTPRPVVRRTRRLDRDDTERRLDVELGDVRAAIALVARGAATRVTVGGLRFGEQVVALLRAEARAKGVVLDPNYWFEDSGCDVIARVADDGQ
jgi:hypothetical protein